MTVPVIRKVAVIGAGARFGRLSSAYLKAPGLTRNDTGSIADPTGSLQWGYCSQRALEVRLYRHLLRSPPGGWRRMDPCGNSAANRATVHRFLRNQLR